MSTAMSRFSVVLRRAEVLQGICECHCDSDAQCGVRSIGSLRAARAVRRGRWMIPSGNLRGKTRCRSKGQ